LQLLVELALEVPGGRQVERYSILGYLPRTPDDVQWKQLALLGVQLNVELTQSLKQLPQVLKMVLTRFLVEQ